MGTIWLLLMLHQGKTWARNEAIVAEAIGDRLSAHPLVNRRSYRIKAHQEQATRLTRILHRHLFVRLFRLLNYRHGAFKLVHELCFFAFKFRLGFLIKHLLHVLISVARYVKLLGWFLRCIVGYVGNKVLLSCTICQLDWLRCFWCLWCSEIRLLFIHLILLTIDLLIWPVIILIWWLKYAQSVYHFVLF